MTAAICRVYSPTRNRPRTSVNPTSRSRKSPSTIYRKTRGSSSTARCTSESIPSEPDLTQCDALSRTPPWRSGSDRVQRRDRCLVSDHPLASPHGTGRSSTLSILQEPSKTTCPRNASKAASTPPHWPRQTPRGQRRNNERSLRETLYPRWRRSSVWTSSRWVRRVTFC